MDKNKTIPTPIDYEAYFEVNIPPELYMHNVLPTFVHAIPREYRRFCTSSTYATADVEKFSEAERQSLACGRLFPHKNESCIEFPVRSRSGAARFPGDFIERDSPYRVVLLLKTPRSFSGGRALRPKPSLVQAPKYLACS